jgi:hypothetical protein
VAIAAIDAELAGVVLVAELDRLLHGDVGTRVVVGPHQHDQQPQETACEKHRAEDRHARERVRAAVKNLRHDAERSLQTTAPYSMALRLRSRCRTN